MIPLLMAIFLQPLLLRLTRMVPMITLTNQTLSVLTTNDDSAGFTIAESDSTTVVTETGSTDTFTVVLDAEPDSDVVIDLSTPDATESSVSPSTLFYISQLEYITVSVTGVNDSGDISSTITSL